MVRLWFNIVLVIVSVVGLLVIVHHFPDNWGWWGVAVAVLIGYVGGYLIGQALREGVRDLDG